MRLTPAIIQDARTGEVLTLAYMNDEALQRTRDTGETWLWSRSRNELWHKGATSGNTQRVVAISEDCDADALLISVIPNGPACHTGARSCFRNVPPRTLDRLMNVLRDRREKRPEGSYTAGLFNGGRGRIAKKIGEEATEVVIAALSGRPMPPAPTRPSTVDSRMLMSQRNTEMPAKAGSTCGTMP